MADPIWEFDPTSEDAANAPLVLSVANGYGVTAFNPDAANQSVQWASSVDTEGALPASVKDENRSISMTIECLTAAALRTLQAKVGKISRERGTLKYTLPNSEVVIFDLLARESFKPEFDVKYFIHSGADCTVTLSFTAKPYGRGTAIQNADRVETTLPALVWTETALKGDVNANASLLIDNDGANTYEAMVWGLRSRYYSSASTAALFYQAESCADATIATVTGASGGGTNNAATKTALLGGSNVCVIGTSSTAQTHLGTYRVFARVQAPSANTQLVEVAVRWRPTLASADIDNDWVAIASDLAAVTPLEGSWVMVDLGLISIPKASFGTQGWLGRIRARGNGTDTIAVDYIALIPAERSGMVRDAGNFILDHVSVRSDGVEVESSTTGYYGTPIYEGQYLTVPPAGAEGRTAQFIVIFLGNFAVSGPNVYRNDGAGGGPDDMSARLTYTPRYLVVPEP